MNGHGRFWKGEREGGAGVEGKVGQRWDGRGCVTHKFLFQAKCGIVKGAYSRLLPVHRHDMAIVTRQRVPDSEKGKDR